MIYEVTLAEKVYRVELTSAGDRWQCMLDGREFPVDVTHGQNGVLSLLLGGKSYEVKQDATGQSRYVALGHRRYRIEMRDPRSLRTRRAAAGDEDGPRKLLASMPGKIVRVLAPEGSTVEAGQGVIVVEAMKMQNELKSPKSGVVKRVLASEGDAVNAGDTLVIVE